VTKRSGFLWYLPNGDEQSAQDKEQAGDYMVADYLVSVAYQSWRLKNSYFRNNLMTTTRSAEECDNSEVLRDSLGQFSMTTLSKLEKELNGWLTKFKLQRNDALTGRMKKYGFFSQHAEAFVPTNMQV
jgi:hypothetical protein